MEQRLFLLNERGKKKKGKKEKSKKFQSPGKELHYYLFWKIITLFPYLPNIKMQTNKVSFKHFIWAYYALTQIKMFQSNFLRQDTSYNNYHPPRQLRQYTKGQFFYYQKSPKFTFPMFIAKYATIYYAFLFSL